MKQLVLGILAHVDAGKTTLSEALLYRTGAIRDLGRVDHKNAHMDTHALERARGITIFSRQARMTLGDTAVTLLDTPGHVDFSAEMERTLQVLDYAVLVISGTDGVQAHTQTLWQLLRRYRVPVFVFVTKMDLPGAERAALMDDLCAHLSGACVDFTDPDPEQIALCDEAALEQYLDTGALPDAAVRALIRGRKLFPCLFGSGLKLTGVDELLAALTRYAAPPDYPSEFGARVYKIMRDAQGNRLTCLKVTGGQMRVRTPLTYLPRGADTPVQEKVNAIRLYAGEKFETAEAVSAGGVCAVQGLTQTYPGQGLGSAAASMPPSLEPVLTYRIGLPPDVDARAFLPRLRELEEEDPQLHIVWDEALREIHVQLMGTVQIEVLKQSESIHPQGQRKRQRLCRRYGGFAYASGQDLGCCGENAIFAL